MSAPHALLLPTSSNEAPSTLPNMPNMPNAFGWSLQSHPTAAHACSYACPPNKRPRTRPPPPGLLAHGLTPVVSVAQVDALKGGGEPYRAARRPKSMDPSSLYFDLQVQDC